MSKPLQITDANFQLEVLESTQPVLVDFWAAWCGPCRMVNPIMEALAEQFDGSAKVGKLNIDENRESPSGYNVHSIPAVLLFKNGRLMETFVGVQPKERYEQALRKAAT